MIQQSTTYTFTFLMVLTSDHLSPATGKTVTVNLSKAGATFAAAAGTVTEIGNGWYKCAFTTADTGTLGDISINATATACDPTDSREQIVSWTTNLDATISSRSTYAGGAVASVTGAVGSVTGLTAANLDVAVSTRLATAGYTAPTTPPTAAAIRTEMDANSTKLVNLDAAVSTRSTFAGGAVASVTGAVGSVTGLNSSLVDAAISTRATPAQVQTSVAAELDAAGTELTAIPGTAATVRQALRYLFEYFNFKRTVTATAQTLYKADSSTVLGTSAISDDGTTATFGKVS